MMSSVFIYSVERNFWLLVQLVRKWECLLDPDLLFSASDAGWAREVKGMGRSEAAGFEKNQTFWKSTSCWGSRPTFLHHFLLQTSGNDQRIAWRRRGGGGGRSHLHYIARPPTHPHPHRPQQNRILQHVAVSQIVVHSPMFVCFLSFQASLPLHAEFVQIV